MCGRVLGSDKKLELSSKDKRIIEYMLMNWRVSLLSMYSRSSHWRDERTDETLARTVNRCSVILSMIRSGASTLGDLRGGLREKIMDQLSMLMAEIEMLIDEASLSMEEFSIAEE